MTATPELRAWLQAGAWDQLQRHFSSVAPASAEAFEARALTTMALRPGPEGARLAVADLRRACTLLPGNVLMAANLMQALIDSGDTAQALQLTTDAMRQAPQVLPLAEKHAWALLAAGRWDDARHAVQHALGLSPAGAAAPALVALAEELRGGWWQPQPLGGITLRLPVEADRDFVARCFVDRDFIMRYRRFQAADDAAVSNFLALARRRPRQSARIDWIVCRGAEALGLASLSDLEFTHRRGELLVGLLAPDARTPVGLKATLAVMDVAFNCLGLHKLVSYVYGDNPEAQANTLHLGLRAEGLLRAHLLTADGALDLHVNGLLADEFHADARLQRLLARWRGAQPEVSAADRSA